MPRFLGSLSLDPSSSSASMIVLAGVETDIQRGWKRLPVKRCGKPTDGLVGASPITTLVT